ncbi:ribonuclease H-like domain-containing protein [Paenibacillus sp. MBLB4367]|uniref:ribonuclease H-like domain-containing protein n=1 Tax=Paenibacillus sp. MBLB4367 TaxID=3384767 RepID=UPI0039080CE8
MSLLREKLSRLTKPAAAGKTQRADSGEMTELSVDGNGERRSEGNERNAERTSFPSRSECFEEPEHKNEWAVCGAQLFETENGSFVMRRTSYSLEHRHGRYWLKDIHKHAGELNAFLEDGQESAGPENLLFFDTETTGLGHGAGNVPFMLGLGYFEREAFVIEQMLMRNPAEEVAMLAYLETLLKRFTHLVSYNGRAFDWPIVKNRYVLNRMKQDSKQIGHLDFLYASRSLWRHTLPSCKLGKVEEEKLGFTRTDDVLGSLAPTLYFLYLAEKDPSVLKGVFEHNEHDILSLAGLAVLLSRRLNGLWSAERMEEEELYRLGLWLDKMGKSELSERAFGELLSRPERESGRYWSGLAGYYKQKGEWTKAVKLWHRAADERTEQSMAGLEPFIELAKYYEHRSKQFVEALRYAEEAQKLAWKRAALSRRDAKLKEVCDELRKRIERLREKQTRLDLLEAGGEDTAQARNVEAKKTRPQAGRVLTQGTMTF